MCRWKKSPVLKEKAVSPAASHNTGIVKGGNCEHVNVKAIFCITVRDEND
jgi:hypothetical protein